MRNDRDDDKYEGSEGSEYHYSEDSYESEGEPTKQQAGTSDVTVDKSAKTKRMYISLAAFVVLVGVVYKMVMPSSSQPSLDITHQAQTPAVQTAAATQPAAPASTVIPVQSAASAPQPAAPPAQQQALDAMQKVLQAQQANAAVQSNQQAPAQQPQQAAAPAQQAANAVNAMQQMMGQISQNAAAAAAQPSAQPAMPVPPPTSGNSPVNQAIDNSSAAINNQINAAAAANDAEIQRKLTEFQNQNKNLQDQLQILNSRIALMESQMNQLVQTLTQQYQSGGQPSAPMPPVNAAPQQPMSPSSMATTPPAPEMAAASMHIPYNVQAIIPGRAWLRSNNGDTITVAENDEVKGIGRVTKIDPYDGVVVLDVHGKPVALSYGNSN